MCAKSYICDFCKTLTLLCVNFGTCICASLSTGLSLFSKSNGKGGYFRTVFWFWIYVKKTEIIILQFGINYFFIQLIIFWGFLMSKINIELDTLPPLINSWFERFLLKKGIELLLFMFGNKTV